MIQGLPENNKYKVRIQCSTYNHSKYIEDALRGFSIQQTNFPFVCCVMDDASTDGEQEILRRWVNNHCIPEEVQVYDHPLTIVLMAPDKDNQNCIYAIHLLKYNTWGKPERRELLEHWRRNCEYEALCEGDDYWIDPLKLQKQVDFMELHPNHSLCFHAHYREYNNGTKVVDRKYLEDKDVCSAKDVILGGGGYMATNSMLYRRELGLNDYPKWAQEAPVGDLPLMLVLLERGNIGYLKDTMSTYRINSVGSWTNQLESLNFRKTHRKKMRKVLKDFDSWSKYKYHKYVFRLNFKCDVLMILSLLKSYMKL